MLNIPMPEFKCPAKHIPSDRIERLRDAVRRFESRYKTGGPLWDHQNSAMGAVGSFFNDSLEKLAAGQAASGAIVMPTGSGKTALAAEIIKATGARALILAPTVKIALQHYDELRERAPEFDV